MSHTYHLTCIDCGIVLDLGKIVCLGEAGNSIPWSFFGWRDLQKGQRIEGAQLWELLQRFTIIHRGHELRILPEPFINSVDPEGQLAYVDSAQEVFDTEILPQPDDVKDAKAIPKNVEKKLKMRMKCQIKNE